MTSCGNSADDAFPNGADVEAVVMATSDGSLGADGRVPVCSARSTGFT